MSNDNELRNKLASEADERWQKENYDGGFCTISFKEGWDAARANPIPVGAIIDVDQNALIAERDQLRAEVERLKDQVAVLEYRSPSALMKERDRLKRMVDVMRDACKRWAYCSGSEADSARVKLWQAIAEVEKLEKSR